MIINGSTEQQTDTIDLDTAASQTTSAETKAQNSAATDEANREAVDPADAESKNASAATKSRGRPRSVSLSLRSLVTGAVILLLIAAAATLGWLYIGARNQLHAQTVQSANDSRAEKIALDYAVSAATMDYKDLQAWKVKLVQGTSPELNGKLSDAGTSMEQVLVPLQWSSSARPLVAKVRSNTGGVYVVDSFVSVDTKTIQSPDPLQSTATYSTTIDSNNNWLITDVGGIGSALESK
jgi:Mce-associated membrane protein